MLLIPFLGWIITGMVFLAKPGYSAAYAKLSPRLYPVEERFTIEPRQDWLEIRLLRTALGYHLLVNTHDGWQHLDPLLFEHIPKPGNLVLTRLLEDAISDNRQRYGKVKEISENRFITSTGVELTIDWNTLTIDQQGRDTRLINTLYKIHYLQWLGDKRANLILGTLGLFGLLLLVYYGVLLYLRGRSYRAPEDNIPS